jgi:hypothetical protein
MKNIIALILVIGLFAFIYSVAMPEVEGIQTRAESEFVTPYSPFADRVVHSLKLYAPLIFVLCFGIAVFATLLYTVKTWA